MQSDAGFEALLCEHRAAVERYVRFRIPSREDAEDVLQETYVTAYRHFESLKSAEAFKPWLLSIARNRCADHFRAMARRMELPLEEETERALVYGRIGPTRQSAVGDALERLTHRDRQILELYYFRRWTQAQIAAQLCIPLGTVKSRLHTAKRNFRTVYPRRMDKEKEIEPMKREVGSARLPEIMPEYRIEKQDEAPFAVVCEELMGWPIVPRLGERCTWGLYDQPSGRRTEYTDMEVVGRAQVHGIEGVEIVAMQNDAEDYYRTGRVETLERRFVAQLTDTHCRYLAESHVEGGVRRVYTFLDGDSLISNWGFGEDNCGSETHRTPKGIITREGSVVTCRAGCETQDVVGRYAVTLGGKRYDTVLIMDVTCFNDAVVSEQYVDREGRTVLWRRFNRDDWALDHFGGRRWSEKLPQNERLTVNGETYVHWYDCITDRVV